MTHSNPEITYIAGVANGGADSPAAIGAFDVGKPTGLDWVPLVYAAGGLAGYVAAAEAGEDFVHCVHVNYIGFAHNGSHYFQLGLSWQNNSKCLHPGLSVEWPVPKMTSACLRDQSEWVLNG